MDTDHMKTSLGKVKGFLLVKDKYGRIVVDEEIFHDTDRLLQLQQEVLKNASNPQYGDPKRDS